MVLEDRPERGLGGVAVERLRAEERQCGRPNGQVSLTTGCRRRWAGWEVLGRRIGRSPTAPEPER